MAQLDQALLESREAGLWLVNFFNGRLLSAEDLRREQHARDLVDARLGRVVGEGVARGLEISVADPQDLVLKATAGLAVNRQGRTLTLEHDVEIELSLPPVERARGQGFDRCKPESGLGAAPGPGAYLLTLYPVEEDRERAEVSGLGNAVAPCNVRFVAHGVRFRLVPLAPALAGATVPQDDERLRNWLAYRCFGAGEDHPAKRLLDVGHANDFGADGDDYGLLARLRPNALTDCDVPLAVLNVRPGRRVDFVDGWAVRRRPHRPQGPGRWSALVGERRQVEGEAMFLQFQDQLAAMLAGTADLRRTVASDRFAYLPPVGLLPVGGNRFDARRFFREGVTADDELDPAQLRQVVQHALALEPIDVRRWIDARAPVIRRYALRGVGQFVLFVRDDRRPAAPPPPPPQTEDPVTPGRFVIRLIDEGKRFVGAAARARVWAQDKKGRTFPARLVEAPIAHADVASMYVLGAWRPDETERAGTTLGGATHGGITHGGTTHGGAILEDFGLGEFAPNLGAIDEVWTESPGFGVRHASYVIENVPPGAYFLKAEVPKYVVASEAATVAEGQQVSVALRLRPVRVEPPATGHGCYWLTDPLVDLSGVPYGRLCVPDDPRIVDWDREFPLRDPRVLEVLPEEVLILDGLLDKVLERDPSTPITPHAARVVVEAGHRPGTVPRDPYAYLVTEDGAGVPIILTAHDRALPGPVATSESGVPELGRAGYATALSGSALQRMDAFAGAWATLVADTLRVSTAMATSLIEDVDVAAKATKEGRTYYAGLEPQHVAALAAADLGTDAALANATVEQVRAALGTDDASGFAARLIQQARAFVPASAWSLTDPGNREALGISDRAVERATVLGFDSLGALHGALEGGRDAIMETLDLTPTEFDHLNEHVPELLDLARVESRAEPSFAAVAGLDGDRTSALVGSRIRNVSMLADTPADEVAVILGVPEADAKAIVASALTNVLTHRGALDEAEAATIVRDTGATLLRDLGRVDANAAGDWSASVGTVRAVGALAASGRIRIR